MKQNDPINVVFCGDRFILQGIYLCILSILKNTKNRDLNFYLFTMSVASRGDHGLSINEDDRLMIDQLVKKANINNCCYLYDISDNYQKTIGQSKNHRSYYSPYASVRLFIQDYLNCDKIIYLDTDTMTLDSLARFEQYNIDEIELAAVLDHLGRRWVHPDYFNSGVLYINMNNIKKTNLFKRCIDLLLQKKYFMADQSAINELVTSHIILPSTFNEQRKIKKDTVVAHFPKHIWKFYNPVKPWHISRMHKINKIHDFDREYNYYLNNFPFADLKIEKPDIDLSTLVDRRPLFD
jgi:lipopolysaccharide biosynthesis glycosyltransferase